MSIVKSVVKSAVKQSVQPRGRPRKPLPPKQEVSEDEKMFILRLHGEGAGFDRIQTEVLEKYRFKADVAVLKKICIEVDNQVYVERYRDDYLSKVKSVPIANKRIRLDDFQRMRDTMFEMIGLLDVNDSEDRKEIVAIFNRLKDVLSVVRDEMEGKPWLLQQINVTELSHTSDAELQMLKERLISQDNGSYATRDIGITEDNEGAEVAASGEPAQVPLAPPG